MKDIYDYIPLESHNTIQQYLSVDDLEVKIKNERATKHGDFRSSKKGDFLITINNNLNPYQFLLTLVHEIAHYKTYKQYGRVKPHGIEWKQTFKDLMLPFLRPEIYPMEILPHLAKYLLNAKASTDSDASLSRALKQPDIDSNKNYIFDLKIGAKFEFKQRLFRLLEKKRTRSICLDIRTQKKYLIHLNSEVTPLS